jgi:drug/metabolite transporter (DMT)-like permease
VSARPFEPRQGSPVYWFLVLLFCLSWSSAYPVAKLSIGVSPPLLFLGVRFLLAALLLLGYAACRGEFEGPIPWAALLLLGLLNLAGYQGFFWEAMRTESAGMAVVVGSLVPILTAACAAPLLGERLTPPKLAGLLLGMAGAVFVVRNRLEMGEDPGGVWYLIAGLVTMTAGTILFKRLAPAATLSVAVGVQQLSAGLVLLIIGMATEDPTRIVLDATYALTLAWFVLVVSVGAMLLWFLLLRAGTATAATSLHFLMPPLGLLMTWGVLGEKLHPSDLLGIVPVALGIWLATRPDPTPKETLCAASPRS